MNSLRLTRDHLVPLLLSEDERRKLGYIIDVPDGPGGSKPSEVGNTMKCERCAQPYQVKPQDQVSEECEYHYGKQFTRLINGKLLLHYFVLVLLLMTIQVRGPESTLAAPGLPPTVVDVSEAHMSSTNQNQPNYIFDTPSHPRVSHYSRKIQVKLLWTLQHLIVRWCILREVCDVLVCLWWMVRARRFLMNLSRWTRTSRLCTSMSMVLVCQVLVT